MRILIIPSEFYDYSTVPNAGIFQKDQAEILLSKGHQVAILSAKPIISFIDIKNYLLLRNKSNVQRVGLFNAITSLLKAHFLSVEKSIKIYSKNGIRIYKYRGAYFSYSNKLQNKRRDWLKIGDYLFKEYLKENGKPDIIHAHNLIFAGMLANYLSHKLDLAMVLTEHSSAHHFHEFPKQESQLIKEELIQIDFKYAVSTFLANLLEDQYALEKDTVGWLPNVVNPIFEERILDEKLSKTAFKFISIGSLIPLKQHRNLILSFHLAFQNSKDIILEIIGDGPLKYELQQLITQLKLSNQVFLLGQLSRSEILKKLNESSCLVHASEFETFGVVHIESLAMGKPIITTKCGGPESFINTSNGILVEKENIEEFSKAMKDMLTNYGNYNSTVIRDELINRFGKEAFYSRIKEIYLKSYHSNLAK